MHTTSCRVPCEDIARALQRVEVAFEQGNHPLEDGCGRPAVGSMGGADGAGLGKQVDLVVAYPEDLPGHVSCAVGAQCDDEGRDFLGRRRNF